MIVTRPLRGSVAWITNVGNDTCAAATARSGSRSPSASTTTSVRRCTAMCRVDTAAGKRGRSRPPSSQCRWTWRVSPSFCGTADPQNARTPK